MYYYMPVGVQFYSNRTKLKNQQGPAVSAGWFGRFFYALTISWLQTDKHEVISL
jgi:hypothetical protein